METCSPGRVQRSKFNVQCCWCVEMKITKFEDIEAWKEARVLVKKLYIITGELKDFAFVNQINRAAVSVMSNIAEGFDRSSNKEFIQYLVVSRGSVSEVKSLLYVALDNGYINSSVFAELADRCDRISGLLNGFIRYLRNSGRKA